MATLTGPKKTTFQKYQLIVEQGLHCPKTDSLYLVTISILIFRISAMLPNLAVTAKAAV
jgi:hypothetical protein